MMDAYLLDALKNERDHQIFHQRAMAFVQRWSPDDPQERWEFTGDLMGLFRDMILTQQHVHQQVATHYFKESVTTLSTIAMSPVIIPKDEK